MSPSRVIAFPPGSACPGLVHRAGGAERGCSRSCGGMLRKCPGNPELGVHLLGRPHPDLEP